MQPACKFVVLLYNDNNGKSSIYYRDSNSTTILGRFSFAIALSPCNWSSFMTSFDFVIRSADAVLSLLQVSSSRVATVHSACLGCSGGRAVFINPFAASHCCSHFVSSDFQKIFIWGIDISLAGYYSLLPLINLHS
jgi:hypothetical protein